MSKRWSHEDDAFLLRWHIVGEDFVAEHDLGRPWGAGTRRMKKLSQTGARGHFARMMYARAEFERACGRMSEKEYIEEIGHWAKEEAEAISAERGYGSAA